MCVICCSRKGAPQPTKDQITQMFRRNPHGAGYMVARDNTVHIHKGFMRLDDYLRQISLEHFTPDDVVVYHFRISTQAGVQPSMTQPFPLTGQLRLMTPLDVDCSCGVAHNGIIPMTSEENAHYSDTALFVAQYMPLIIRNVQDLENPRTARLLQELIGHSKLAILDRSGYLRTIGEFWTDENGLEFSNNYWRYRNIELLQREV